MSSCLARQLTTARRPASATAPESGPGAGGLAGRSDGHVDAFQAAAAQPWEGWSAGKVLCWPFQVLLAARARARLGAAGTQRLSQAGTRGCSH